MNKTKMMLAVTGGAIGLAVLVMAYFTWGAFSAKTVALEGDEEEGVAGLESVRSRAQSLSRKPVFPCAASVTAIESNRSAIVEWQKEAKKLAVRGDRVFPKTTPAAFKEFLVTDAKRLSALPGAVAGVLVKPSFAFGPFKDYISGGKMPAESELAEFQRKWDDVATVVEILAQSGVDELTDVSFAGGAAGEAASGQKPADKGKKAKRPAKSSKPSQTPQSSQASQTFSYVFSFTTKPSAFVKVLNALVVSERFVTAEDFTFTRTQDAIVAKLGGAEKASGASAPASGRRRRRGGAAESEVTADAADANEGIVTDPQLDGAFAVVLTVNVRDFGSLEEEKAEEVAK